MCRDCERCKNVTSAALREGLQCLASTMDMDVDGAGGDDAQTLELISGVELVKKVHAACRT